MLYRYAVDVVRNQIELIQGNELNNDPYIPIFSNIKSKNLHFCDQKSTLADFGD